MRSPTVVVVKERSQAGFGGRNGVVCFQIHLFVFHRSPQPLDNKDVVPPTAFAIHADPDALGLEHVGEFGAGELTPLVGVEDLQ